MNLFTKTILRKPILILFRENKIIGYGIDRTNATLKGRQLGLSGQLVKRYVTPTFIGYLCENHQFLN